ncbi:helicase associated domain-containing protein [Streptomyces sp. TE5632]
MKPLIDGFTTKITRYPPEATRACRQFFEREGHLRVPRKHVERIVLVSEDQEEQELRLGAWIGNQRSRAATLSPERVELLSAIGMRWSS